MIQINFIILSMSQLFRLQGVHSHYDTCALRSILTVEKTELRLGLRIKEMEFCF